jgi:hypothetical protein
MIRTDFDEVNASVELISPTVANELLTRNTINRKVKPAQVDELSRMIRAGKWTCNGSTIVIAEDGTLLDGQHRLLAVVATKTAVPMIVARNVPKSSMPTIGSEIPRKARDVLQMHGFKNTTALASVARMLMAFRDRNASLLRKRANNAETLEYVLARPEVASAVSIMQSINNGTLSNTVTQAWLYMALSTPRAERACQEAVAVFKTGVPSFAGDPIHSFRERMLRMTPRDRSDPGARLFHLYTLNHAWNLFRRSEPISVTKIRQSFVSPVGFDLGLLE